MKQIFQGLVAMQMQTTWQEIYEFRETHVGKCSVLAIVYETPSTFEYKLMSQKLQITNNFQVRLLRQ